MSTDSLVERLRGGDYYPNPPRDTMHDRDIQTRRRVEQLADVITALERAVLTLEKRIEAIESELIRIAQEYPNDIDIVVAGIDNLYDTPSMRATYGHNFRQTLIDVVRAVA